MLHFQWYQALKVSEFDLILRSKHLQVDTNTVFHLPLSRWPSDQVAIKKQ
jgi:hypothetical protein